MTIPCWQIGGLLRFVSFLISAFLHPCRKRQETKRAAPLNATPATHGQVAKEFARKTSCIQDLYGGFRYQGIMVDGKRTEPENIADQAGLKIALQVSTRMRLKSVAVARQACMRVHHQTFEYLSAKQAFKSHLERVSWAPHAQQAPHAGLPDILGGVEGSGRISSDSGAVRLYFVSYGQLW